MSQQDDTLRQRLRQHLDNIEGVNEGKDRLRDHCWRRHRINIALEAIDRLKVTASSHQRAFLEL